MHAARRVPSGTIDRLSSVRARLRQRRSPTDRPESRASGPPHRPVDLRSMTHEAYLPTHRAARPRIGSRRPVPRRSRPLHAGPSRARGLAFAWVAVRCTVVVAGEDRVGHSGVDSRDPSCWGSWPRWRDAVHRVGAAAPWRGDRSTDEAEGWRGGSLPCLALEGRWERARDP